MRVSRIATALARTGNNESTTVQAPTEKPSEAKKATKMRPTKSTTARFAFDNVVFSCQSLTIVRFRNLYAIFYMTEHPNATSAEFSAAFKNLDKSTLLVSCVVILGMLTAATILGIRREKQKHEVGSRWVGVYVSFIAFCIALLACFILPTRIIRLMWPHEHGTKCPIQPHMASIWPNTASCLAGDIG